MLIDLDVIVIYVMIMYLGDEFHLFMECSNNYVVQYRNRYLRPFINNVNMYTFCNIMERISVDNHLAYSVGQFLLNYNKNVNVCNVVINVYMFHFIFMFMLFVVVPNIL